jgi:hypothetical protein
MKLDDEKEAVELDKSINIRHWLGIQELKEVSQLEIKIADSLDSDFSW